MAFSGFRKALVNISYTVRRLSRHHLQFDPTKTGRTAHVFRVTRGNNAYAVPEQVLKNGFTPYYPPSSPHAQTELVRHVQGINLACSQYQSFSRTEHGAINFGFSCSFLPGKLSLFKTHMFRANYPKFHVDVSESISMLANYMPVSNDTFDYARKEGEISGCGVMLPSDIAAWREVDSVFISAALWTALGGGASWVLGIPIVSPYALVSSATMLGFTGVYFGRHYVGDLHHNAAYVCRDYSFRIPSMNKTEYQLYLSGEHCFPEGFQAISYDVAQQIEPVLHSLQRELAHLSTAVDNHLIIDCMVKDDYPDYRLTIAIIQETYCAMRQQMLVDTPFLEVKLSDLIEEALKYQRSYRDVFSFYQPATQDKDSMGEALTISALPKKGMG